MWMCIACWYALCSCCVFVYVFVCCLLSALFLFFLIVLHFMTYSLFFSLLKAFPENDLQAFLEVSTFIISTYSDCNMLGTIKHVAVNVVAGGHPNNQVSMKL